VVREVIRTGFALPFQGDVLIQQAATYVYHTLGIIGKDRVPHNDPPSIAMLG
jgi:hypothetical protein